MTCIHMYIYKPSKVTNKENVESKQRSILESIKNIPTTESEHGGNMQFLEIQNLSIHFNTFTSVTVFRGKLTQKAYLPVLYPCKTCKQHTPSPNYEDVQFTPELKRTLLDSQPLLVHLESLTLLKQLHSCLANSDVL